jgi:translation machinery associated TMA7 protein
MTTRRMPLSRRSRGLVCTFPALRSTRWVANAELSTDEKARKEMAAKASGKGPLTGGGIKKSGKK